jgi:PAS domain S-box-containing protein
MTEDLFRTYFESAPDFVLQVDAKGTILHINRTYRGLTKDEVIGTSVFDWVPEKFRSGVRATLKRVIESGQSEVIEYWAIDAEDATRWHSAHFGPIDQGGRNDTAIVIVRDITERKEVQEELAKRERLDSLGVLAGGLAHDFNNLLTAILANISMAKLYGELKEDVFQMLTDAENASLRAKRLTQQLLAFSKGGAPTKKTVSITKLLKETAEFALSGSNVRCEYSFPHDLWPVEADEGQIAQVIQNLVINADQAMPGGGTLSVNAENLRLGTNDLPVGREGRFIRISFSDHGTGIADKHLPKIFDPFFTTKRKGSGLGLATSFSIVQNHGGHLRVESRAGVGTTFHVYLPASDKPHVAAKRPPTRSLGGYGRILLIDDEEIIRRSAGSLMERLGYEVTVAEDGKTGIRLHEKAVQENRPYDVIIMDLTIPGGMGGEETVKTLKKIDPDVKVVVSSGYSTDAILSRYEEYGFSAAVAKPWKMEELTDTLEQVMGREDDSPAY